MWSGGAREHHTYRKLPWAKVQQFPTSNQEKFDSWAFLVGRVLNDARFDAPSLAWLSGAVLLCWCHMSGGGSVTRRIWPLTFTTPPPLAWQEPLQSVNELKDPGGIEQGLSGGWLCGGDVAPSTQKVGCVIECGGMSWKSCCALRCCQGCVALFVDRLPVISQNILGMAVLEQQDGAVVGAFPSFRSIEYVKCALPDLTTAADIIKMQD